EAAGRVRARLQLLELEAAPLGVARQHPEDVARPERRLVATRRLPDLDDHVLAVGRIRLDERELQLLLEAFESLLELRDELAQIAVAASSLEGGRRRQTFPRALVRRFELLQAPPAVVRRTAAVADRRTPQPRRPAGVAT